MSISRREFLKVAGIGLGWVIIPPIAKPAISGDASPGSASMLYDSTLCIGCRACQMACKRRSNLPPETDSSKLYEQPRDLSANTWTLIKLYQEGNAFAFIKAQCMHCLEPACVSVCPVGALEKKESGPVIYHTDKCIGCRYCMAACPYFVPKYQWTKTFPLIQKCDFCADRQLNGKQPACGEACPTGALISGTRQEMLTVARKRLASSPKYVNHIYGEHEGGGTAMLYISHIPFEKLGLPSLKDYSLPSVTLPFMKSVPWIILTLGSLMTGIYLYTHRQKKAKEE
ncbi:MAG TPA: hydrogenase 2 operon protein HybA [Anaerolineaceae bacterium]